MFLKVKKKKLRLRGKKSEQLLQLEDRGVRFEWRLTWLRASAWGSVVMSWGLRPECGIGGFPVPWSALAPMVGLTR